MTHREPDLDALRREARLTDVGPGGLWLVLYDPDYERIEVADDAVALRLDAAQAADLAALAGRAHDRQTATEDT